MHSSTHMLLCDSLSIRLHERMVNPQSCALSGKAGVGKVEAIAHPLAHAWVAGNVLHMSKVR